MFDRQRSAARCSFRAPAQPGPAVGHEQDEPVRQQQFLAVESTHRAVQQRLDRELRPQSLSGPLRSERRDASRHRLKAAARAASHIACTLIASVSTGLTGVSLAAQARTAPLLSTSSSFMRPGRRRLQPVIRHNARRRIQFLRLLMRQRRAVHAAGPTAMVSPGLNR